MRTYHHRWRVACLAMLLTLLALLAVLDSPLDALAGSVASQRAEANAAQATFPFYDGFESGGLGADWTVQTTNQGRVQVSEDYPYAGTYSLLLDDSQTDSIDSLAAAILTIDLSGQSQVDLDFWGRDFVDEPDPEDGIFISDDYGATWHQVFSLHLAPTFYRHYIFDLDEAATAAGMTLNDHFQIKFQFYDDDSIPSDGYAIDEVRLRPPPSPIPAAFPYYTGFESGDLGDEWLVNFTNEGRVQVSTDYPFSGTHSLLLDDDRTDSIDSLAAAILTVDLSGQSQVDLDFWGRDFSDEPDPEDGIFISDDYGTTWHQVFFLHQAPSFYRHYIFDLDEAATAAGMTLNDHFQIKFQFYDDDSIPTDGYAIDEVRLRPPPTPTPAAFPYYTGFESGDLGDEWLVDFTNEGRVQVSADYPFSGTHSLLLDDDRTDSIDSLAAAILTVDLSGQAQVDLDFWGRDFSDEPDPQDGIFVSDDYGATWHQVFSLHQAPAFFRHYIFDLDEAASAAGMSLNGHFQIKFQFYDDDSIPSDGYAIDEVRLRPQPTPTPAAFPYYTGFESGALGDEWLVDFTYEGRVQVSADYPYTGTHSLLLDDSRSDSTNSLAAAILTVNLAGQPDVVLDFWWREFLDEDHEDDGVFVSDDEGETWHRLLSFNGGTSAWQREVLDLDAECTTLGLALNDRFQIKFQFFDDDSIPSDGYAVDELQVRPNLAPALAWPGDANYEHDGLHPEAGDVRDTYVYRIRYTDGDGDPPASVQVHIKKGGTGIAGSPFTTNCASGDYFSGVICSHSQMGLDEGSDYTYYFAAQDDLGNAAESTPELDAPDASIHYWVHLPLVPRNIGPPAGPPVLDPIDNPEGHYQYTVSWSEPDRATRYTLQEDDNDSFSSPETVYNGTSTSTSVLAEALGTYYYRVKASNEYGETEWSNIQSTVVTVPLPPCPQAGYWAGFTNQAYEINFDVEDAPDCEVTRLTITARLDCFMSGYDIEYTRYFHYSEPIVAREFEYLETETNQTERVSGTFSSGTSASGTWYFFVPDQLFPGRFCWGSGTWTASHQY